MTMLQGDLLRRVARSVPGGQVTNHQDADTNCQWAENSEASTDSLGEVRQGAQCKTNEQAWKNLKPEASSQTGTVQP